MPIIPQYSIQEFEAKAAIAETACNGAKTFSWVTFIITMCLGYGVKYLWKSINVLQFLIFMITWTINIPSNALIAFEALKMLALMEFLDDVMYWILDGFGVESQVQSDGQCGVSKE